jgi:hypothetical protein
LEDSQDRHHLLTWVIRQHFSGNGCKLDQTKTEGKLNRDIKVLIKFVEIYCDNKHESHNKSRWSPAGVDVEGKGNDDPQLCQECRKLLDYSIMRRRLCPLDPKPVCKKCKIHCYSYEYRSKIKEVMRFSGTTIKFLLSTNSVRFCTEYLLSHLSGSR